MPTVDYVITGHAVTRFQERVRPGLSKPAAKDALIRLLADAELVPTAPPWLLLGERADSPAYLVAGDIVFPLAATAKGSGPWLIKTCLTRGGITATARAARKARRRRRPRRASRTTGKPTIQDNLGPKDPNLDEILTETGWARRTA